jgi:hypothetical protein
MSEIIATPIDLPLIEPDDWNVFWEIWNNHSGFMTKLKNYRSSSAIPIVPGAPILQKNLWQGMEIYSTPESVPGWLAPVVDIKEKLPKLYKTISTLPINNVVRATLVQSHSDFLPHHDSNYKRWLFRANFYVTSPTPQFYVTTPGTPTEQFDKKFINLPKETNWFAYDDTKCRHGSDYHSDYPKILLQVMTSTIADNTEIINRSIEKYKNYTIEL